MNRLSPSLNCETMPKPSSPIDPDCLKRIDTPFPWFLQAPQLIVNISYFWLFARLAVSGGLGLLQAVNPGFPSRKSDLLDRIRNEHGAFLPGYCAYAMDAPDGDHLAAVMRCLSAAGVDFPVVAKPEMGLRGLLVKRLNDVVALQEYLDDFAARRHRSGLHFQALLGEPVELTALYIRDPDLPNGRVAALVLRQAPCVVGDGRRTLGALIEQSGRPRYFRDALLAQHSAQMAVLPADGEVVPLGFARNQGRGGLLVDITDRITPLFEQRIDAISKGIDGFHFGRYDLRCRTLDEALTEGRFKIMEVNGALAVDSRVDAENIGFLAALGYAFSTMNLLRRVAVKNARRGVPYPSTSTYLRHLRRVLGSAKSFSSEGKP